MSQLCTAYSCFTDRCVNWLHHTRNNIQICLDSNQELKPLEGCVLPLHYKLIGAINRNRTCVKDFADLCINHSTIIALIKGDSCDTPNFSDILPYSAIDQHRFKEQSNIGGPPILFPAPQESRRIDYLQQREACFQIVVACIVTSTSLFISGRRLIDQRPFSAFG
mgnify:CR=1 FL=1